MKMMFVVTTLAMGMRTMVAQGNVVTEGCIFFVKRTVGYIVLYTRLQVRWLDRFVYFLSVGSVLKRCLVVEEKSLHMHAIKCTERVEDLSTHHSKNFTLTLNDTRHKKMKNKLCKATQSPCLLHLLNIAAFSQGFH